MKTFTYLGHEWPDTGRPLPPAEAKVEIHNLQSKWLDLVYWSDKMNGCWIYVSTILK